jgi:hypothetical protein
MTGVSGRAPASSRRIEAAVRAVLPTGVRVDVQRLLDGDHLIKLNGRRGFRVRFVSRGWPRDVERAIRGSRRPDVVVAPAMSPGARAAAEASGVGWIDETGAAEFTIGPVVVSRSGGGRAVTKPLPRWRPATLGIAEALLCGIPATVSAVRAATGYSGESVRVGLAALQEWGLLAGDVRRGPRSARYIIDTDRLLDEYADAVDRIKTPVELEVGVLWRDPIAGLAEAGQAWDRDGIGWAATGAVAASILAPHLTSVSRSEVLVSASGAPELTLVAAAAGLTPLQGGRLTLRPFPSEGTRELSDVAEGAQGIRVAPWPRVFADLRKLGVRGEEAAEHLRNLQRGRAASASGQ